MKIAHIHVWDKKNKGDHGIVLSVHDILKNAFPGCTIFDFPLETLKSPTEKSIKRINRTDMVVIGGGGILYRYFTPYNITGIKKITPPIVIFGVGYIRETGSKAMNSMEKKSVFALMRRARLVSVRDYYTKQFLQKIGVPTKKIGLIGDPAVFLEKKEVRNPLLEKPGMKIGLNLNYSGWLGFGKYEHAILSSYENLAKRLQKNGGRIFYAMHHPDERKILKKLRIRDMEILDYGAKEQMYAYSKLDIVIGMMLHSVVMSFGAGTPEVNVGYDIRNKNFAKFIHCPELVIGTENLTPDLLFSRVRHVIKHKNEYQKKFQKRKNSIWKLHENYIKKIKDEIRNQKGLHTGQVRNYRA